jgi:microcompartment protein CcmK/EutM
MDVAQVVGQVVSTAKEPALASHTLLIVRRSDPAAPLEDSGPSYVAVDLVGAGRGELVLVVRGSAAREATATVGCPTDAAVVGVVDSVIHNGTVTFNKS